MRPIAARAGIVVALLAGAVAWAAGPAGAHETTTTTVATAAGSPTMAGMAGMTGMTGMTGMAGASPAAAGPEAERDGKGLWPGLALAAAVTVACSAALVAVRRRLGDAPPLAPRDLAGAAALLFAGVAHCALTPSHWAEGWHLGLFFAGSGALLLGQAVVVAVRPSLAAYRSVLVSTTVLIALYVLSREVALPLVGHRDPYLVEDVPVKLAEGFAALVAGAALVRARLPRPVAFIGTSRGALGPVTSA